MTERIIDLAEEPVYLSAKLQQLCLERSGQPVVKVPLEEVAALIIANPRVTSSQAALAGVVSHGGSVVLCNADNMPVGMMLPLQAHSTQTKRLLAQAAAKKPVNKKLWKQVIQNKLKAQSYLLEEIYQHDAGIRGLLPQIRSGDPSNLEAQASRRYWPALFGASFRRDQEGGGINAMLNYGYAILRAVVARSICAVGLHPSLGIHHHNQYNAYALADDLMEPYRPLVDRSVVACLANGGGEQGVTRETKQSLIGGILLRYASEGENRTLFDWISKTSSSLARVYLGESEKLFFPERLDVAQGESGILRVSTSVAVHDVRPTSEDND